MAEKDQNESIIDFTSKKSRRIVRSVICTEKFGFDDACNDATVIQQDLEQIFNKRIKI